MASINRRNLVIVSPTLNGIDFVEIANSAQTILVVHFLNAVPVAGTLPAPPTITGGDTIPSVAVLPIQPHDWGIDGTHVTLTLHVNAPGDFSTYTLTLATPSLPCPALDTFFATVQFSFKALCPSDIDCETPPPVCPPSPATLPPIDYLSKDFLSFRQALLDFSSVQYPGWQERSEADLGIVLLEAMAAVADDLSYTQDRVAAEATLTTATQRRSVVRHARLVDYEPAPALSAQTVLQFDVRPGSAMTVIPFGVRAVAQAADGSPIVFETGPSLLGRLSNPPTPPPPPASALWNGVQAREGIKPYWFDDSTQCLPAGATSMYVLGRGYNFQPNQLLLIETNVGPGQPPQRQVVQLLDRGAPQGPWATELCDLVVTRAAPDAPGSPPPWFACVTSPPSQHPPTAVTQIMWASTGALLVARDQANTTVSGNLVAASQGLTVTDEAFTVMPAAGALATPAIVRIGPRHTNPDGSVGEAVPQYLHTLAAGTLAWLPAPPNTALDENYPQPEIVLQDAGGQVWTWFRRLLDAGPFEQAYTIDPGLWRLLQTSSSGAAQFDYDGDNGDTLRFGDGDFGLIPADGTAFGVTYRVGAGGAGNVAAATIVRIDSGQTLAVGLTAVRNPLAATGGADAETLQHVRRIAPLAFTQPLQRAVIPQDYEAIAATQPWVRRADTNFRWTGSWLTVFTAPDPAGSTTVAPDQRASLATLLNRCRMAGYESYVPDPTYVSVDVLVQLCVLPTVFRADVETAVLAALTAFFAPDAFTFGQALERSVLEAAVQAVPGVAGILCLESRVRGRSPIFTEMPDQIVVATDQIIRCNNDPSAPERGSITVQATGGK
ncbi:MAG TPA: baseplate J/gp47 family protein [Acetobacteraceae bacterium]|nr:baseplate J/gp47 family protein [Acetobacteraceae bacterium]